MYEYVFVFVGPFVCHEFAASGKQHIPKEITEEIKKSDRKHGERWRERVNVVSGLQEDGTRRD